MKNIKLLLFIMLLILCGCSSNKNTPKLDTKNTTSNSENKSQFITKKSNYYNLIESESITYNVSINKYIYKTELIDLVCEYPQFNKNDKTLTKINKIIENEIHNKFETDIQNTIIDDVLYIQGECDVVFQNSQFISIVFRGSTYSKKLPYTTEWLYSINLDIENESIVKLSDMIDINDNFLNVFLDNLKAQYASEIVEYFTDMDKELLLQDFLDSDILRGQEQNRVVSYYKDGKIYISYTVLNVLGDYIVVEIL